MATVTKPIALDESFHTTETPSRNIADVLASLGDAISQGAQPVTKKLATNSFKTINGGLVDGLTVQFTPVQDLHGYSKPWAGGAGKQLANPSNIVSTADIVFDSDAETFTFASASGSNTVLQFLFKANTPYTISITKVSSGESAKPCIIVRNTDGTTTGQQTNYSNSSLPLTVQFSEDTNWNIRLQSASSGGTTVAVNSVFKMMVEKGSSPSTWEPYSNICPISGHTEAKSQINNTTYTTSLGGTYYGGEVDMVSGEGKVTLGYIDLGSLTYNYDSTNRRYTGFISGIKNTTARTMKIISDIYETMSDGEAFDVNWDNVIYNSGNTVMIHNHAYTDPAAFKTAMSGYYITYDLATPTTLTLTGQNITAEVGVNNVSTPLTGQEIKPDSVIYKDMFTWEDVLKVI